MHSWIQIRLGRWEMRVEGEVIAVIQRDVTLWRWVVGESCGVARDLQAAMLAAAWVGGYELPDPEPLPMKKSA